MTEDYEAYVCPNCGTVYIAFPDEEGSGKWICDECEHVFHRSIVTSTSVDVSLVEWKD